MASKHLSVPSLIPTATHQHESCVPGTQNTENGVKIEFELKPVKWLVEAGRDCLPYPPVSPERPASWSEQQWESTLSKEELKQCCSRCKEIGHSNQHCPYPILYMTVSYLGGGPDWVMPVVWQPAKGIYRWSHCGQRGHNCCTCHGPVFY